MLLNKMNPLGTLSEFKTLPEISDKLIEYGFVKRFYEGEVIQQEDAYIRAIPIVISGSIRVMRNDDDGHEILLYFIKAGESCIMSFLGGLHQDTSKVKAVVEEETEILFVPVEKVNKLIKEYPEWLDYIFKLYHKRFEELLQIVNDVAFKKMDERLLNFLKRKAQLQQHNIIQITHEQLANDLGTARVVVSRLLKQMETDGIVQLSRNKVVLLID